MRLIRKLKHSALFFIFLNGTYPVYAARQFLISLHPMIIKRGLSILVIINQFIGFLSVYLLFVHGEYLRIPVMMDDIDGANGRQMGEVAE